MSREKASILKTYFQTGDVPTESEYSSLIDSTVLDIYNLTKNSGTSTAYVVEFATPYTSLVNTIFVLQFDKTNTGASTLKIDSLTAVPIVKNGGNAIVSGDLQQKQIYLLAYDNENGSFEILSVVPQGYLSSVNTDSTLNGDGTAGSPLSVVQDYLINVNTDSTLSGNGTAGSPLSVVSSGGGIGTGTTAQMLASSPSVGDQWYNTENLKFWLYSDKLTWFVPGETIILNKQSGILTEGQLVIPDDTLTSGVQKATVVGDIEIIGVVVFDVDTELYVVIATTGIWNVLCSDDSNPYNVGDFLVHDGTPAGEDGKAKERSSGSGHMAICMENTSVPIGLGGGLLKAFIQTTERY